MTTAPAVLDHMCVACEHGRHEYCCGCPCAGTDHTMPVRAVLIPDGRHKDLSADARRTARQRDLLAAGVHPATGRPLLAGSEATCASCVHATAVHRGNTRAWKCEVHRLGMSHSAASDIRVSWPACELYERQEVPA